MHCFSIYGINHRAELDPQWVGIAWVDISLHAKSQSYNKFI